MIRAVLGAGGRPPLEVSGIETHRKLALLDETVGGPLRRHDSALTGQLARHLHRAVIRSHDLARMVARLHRFVKRAARILGRKKGSSNRVKADFDLLLDRAR